MSKDDPITKSINKMQEALLGLAEVEGSLLQNIKIHLDAMLNKIYTEMREYQHTATKEAMLTETPITKADETVLAGFNAISVGLNEKNQEIMKLQSLLASMGASLTTSSNQSIESLRQHLEELNKRNKILREIHGKLIRHPMITGKIPKNVTPNEIKKMLETLNDQIKTLNQTNIVLKQKIKPKLEASKQIAPTEKPVTITRRGPG